MLLHGEAKAGSALRSAPALHSVKSVPERDERGNVSSAGTVLRFVGSWSVFGSSLGRERLELEYADGDLPWEF
jgi:hypothetical protein